MVGNTAVYYMAACLCKGIYLNSFAVGLMKKNAGTVVAGCGVDINPVQKQPGSAVESQITITITKARPRMHK